MLALGIDPGSAICGYGIVEMQGNHYQAICSGAVQTSPKTTMPERLQLIYRELSQVIEQYRPTCMGIEKLFFNRNVTSAMAVAQARGIVLLVAADHDLAVSEFTPLEVKQAVVGYGKATKDQVMYMTQKLLKLSQQPQLDDVADALAIAICTLNFAGSRAEWGRSL
jgi:crossover junction endodeoxyribonuclease RuvC